jgi:hypothetical protein
MNSGFRKLLPAAVLIACLVPSVFAQNGYYRQPMPDQNRRDHALFDRARADLDRAGAYPYSSRDDRKRFDEARRELFDFESRFDRGRYEKHELDQAIDRIQRVVSHNSLDPRSRGELEEDLRRMRDFREYRNHHDYEDGYR